MHKRLLYLIPLTLLSYVAYAQQEPLSIQKIMQDPAKWIGTAPSQPEWAENGQRLYFRWNPEKAADDSLYAYELRSGNISKVDLRKELPPANNPYYNASKAKKLYTRWGDLYEEDARTGEVKQLTRNLKGIGNYRYAANNADIYFTLNDNLYLLNRSNGSLQQLTDFRKESKSASAAKPAQEKWLEQDQLAHFQVLQERKANREAATKNRNRLTPKKPSPFYLEGDRIDNQQASPNGRYITFRLLKNTQDESTLVPNYVTESGYTENLNTRPKVGGSQTATKLGIYDTWLDTVYYLQTYKLPGFDKQADFAKDYPEKKFKRNKDVVVHGPFYPANGDTKALVEVRSMDNKDRWIGIADLGSGQLKVLDHQRDEAWIGGPGIGWLFSPGELGWMPGGEKIWFQSEASGYSHLYTADVAGGGKKQLTEGTFEIYEPQISNKGKYWYFHANKGDAGVRHFYRMPIDGGPMEQLTQGEGRWDATLSPDEKQLALLYSNANTPPELYIQPTKAGAKPKKLTESLTEEWKAYPWRKPEFVQFTARDGAKVPARLYRPGKGGKGGPAVIFVHGAGYLQNAHKWWSSYFREYMFHNLLADKGYTVLDIDYRGSAGYGRDWRTAIYRHMGGKDLTDQVDGAQWLVDELGVDSSRLGIYGGSYGGFITLMAMFTQPEVFEAGAALRSVTDWAHYNHPYTANILNEPYTDSLAYARSSPIYYAEGLKGKLLIAHGMIDTNVHFQDVVRLSQRLIELGKEDWEMALYPLEDHSFVEPSSWTDEYRRILKLFEESIGEESKKAAD